MNETLRLRQLIHLSGKSLALSGSLLLLVACKFGSESGSKEILVEAVPTESALTTVENAQVAEADSSYAVKANRAPAVEADKPLHFSFDNSNNLVGDNGSLLFRGHHTVAYTPDQGHFQLGSVLVEKRRETWHGPLITLPKLDAGRAYRASAWIRLIDAKQPAQVKLILTRVAEGDTTSLVLSQTLAEPGAWQKIDGEFVGATHWHDDITALSLDVDNIETRYLVDDVMVTYAELSDELEAAAAVASKSKLVRNGDVEDGIEHWDRQGGIISRSTAQAQSGAHSLLISGRTESWHAPTMAVYGLEDNKVYKFSIFARLNEGEEPANMRLTMKRVTNGQESFLPIASAQATSSGWVKVSGPFSSTNISKSERVAVYLESDSPTASYFVDTLTVEEVR